jgi:hypothetical protein
VELDPETSATHVCVAKPTVSELAFCSTHRCRYVYSVVFEVSDDGRHYKKNIPTPENDDGSKAAIHERLLNY